MHKLAKYKNYHHHIYSAEDYKIICTFIKTRSIQNFWDDPNMSTFFFNLVYTELSLLTVNE